MSTTDAPSVHVRALVTWVAVYPTITIALLVLRPWIRDLAVPVQTLALTAVVVPIAAYCLNPLLFRVVGAIRKRLKG